MCTCQATYTPPFASPCSLIIVSSRAALARATHGSSLINQSRKLMNWIEKTVDEIVKANLKDEDFKHLLSEKLKESYKNGAQAERRKASTKPEASDKR